MISHDGSASPIFLLSMPRSGSTLLSLMLGSHPDVCCPPEPWIVLALAEVLGLGGVRNAPYGREWAEIAAMEFLLHPERTHRGALGKAFRDMVAAPCQGAIEAATRTLQTIYQLHLDASGKQIFVDKTPRYYTVLGLIDQVFPHAKKIILLRDPLDVLASYKSTWEIPRDMLAPGGVTVHARDFCEGLFQLANFATTGGNNIVVVRYEDLARSPESVLRLVCEFVGIEFSPTMLAYHENTALIEEYRRSPVGDPVSSRQPRPANTRTVGAWETRLDRLDVQALVDVLGVKVFEDLGYCETVIRLREMSADIPTEEVARRRRHELMHALVDRVREQPFSVWNNFVSPLRHCLADRTARLEVIQRQQTELEQWQQMLADSEADRAARLEAIREQQGVIQEQQEELEQLRSFSGSLRHQLGRFKKRISRSLYRKT
jgi:hypothetical protein